jgi:hypothetical protein
MIIIVLIHGIHILFFFLFLFPLILILCLLGLTIIRTSLLMLHQLKLTLIGLILNVIITASSGVTSMIMCLCTPLS